MQNNQVEIFIVALITTLITCYLIIKTEFLHGHISGDNFLDEPQKVHQVSVTRIGGIAIFIGIIVSLFLNPKFKINEIQYSVILSCLPAFLIGLLEDLTKKIRPALRILVITLGAISAIILLKIRINHTDIVIFDWALQLPIIAFIFTIFAITGLTNSFNIIDGLNGLASMVGIFSLVGILLILSNNNDQTALNLCLIIIASIFGFLIWNYPKGLIFLGDGGAYLIGFLISVLSIYVVITVKTISPWFAITLNSYPIIETIFSIYRRRLKNNLSPSTADSFHLHSLLYKYILHSSIPKKLSFLENSKASLYIFLLSAFTGFPALFWPSSTMTLVLWFFVSLLIYLLIYRYLINSLKK